MKICNSCKVEKPTSEFNKKKDGFQPYCKICDREASRARYRANSESHKKAVGERNKKVRSESKQWIAKYLLSHPCVDCGNSDIRVLEFDHIGTKRNNISTMIAQACSLDSIKAEVLQCEVRCANCHRIVTHERAGSWRALYSPVV